MPTAVPLCVQPTLISFSVQIDMDAIAGMLQLSSRNRALKRSSAASPPLAIPPPSGPAARTPSHFTTSSLAPSAIPILKKPPPPTLSSGRPLPKTPARRRSSVLYGPRAAPTPSRRASLLYSPIKTDEEAAREGEEGITLHPLKMDEEVRMEGAKKEADMGGGMNERMSLGPLCTASR